MTTHQLRRVIACIIIPVGRNCQRKHPGPGSPSPRAASALTGGSPDGRHAAKAAEGHGGAIG